jgi:hypothetical protein
MPQHHAPVAPPIEDSDDENPFAQPELPIDLLVRRRGVVRMKTGVGNQDSRLIFLSSMVD